MTKDQAIKMLKELRSFAIDASMSGDLQDGVVVMVPIYQKIRAAAIKNEWVDEDLVFSFDEELHDVEMTDVLAAAAGLFLKLLED